jgi:hypothetical protein
VIGVDEQVPQVEIHVRRSVRLLERTHAAHLEKRVVGVEFPVASSRGGRCGGCCRCLGRRWRLDAEKRPELLDHLADMAHLLGRLTEAPCHRRQIVRGRHGHDGGGRRRRRGPRGLGCGVVELRVLPAFCPRVPHGLNGGRGRGEPWRPAHLGRGRRRGRLLVGGRRRGGLLRLRRLREHVELATNHMRPRAVGHLHPGRLRRRRRRRLRRLRGHAEVLGLRLHDLRLRRGGRGRWRGRGLLQRMLERRDELPVDEVRPRAASQFDAGWLGRRRRGGCGGWRGDGRRVVGRRAPRILGHGRGSYVAGGGGCGGNARGLDALPVAGGGCLVLGNHHLVLEARHVSLAHHHLVPFGVAVPVRVANVLHDGCVRRHLRRLDRSEVLGPSDGEHAPERDMHALAAEHPQAVLVLLLGGAAAPGDLGGVRARRHRRHLLGAVQVGAGAVGIHCADLADLLRRQLGFGRDAAVVVGGRSLWKHIPHEIARRRHGRRPVFLAGHGCWVSAGVRR